MNWEEHQKTYSAGMALICPECGGSSASFCECAKTAYHAQNRTYNIHQDIGVNYSGDPKNDGNPDPKVRMMPENMRSRFTLATKKLQELSTVSIPGDLIPNAWKTWKHLNSLTDERAFEQLVPGFEDLINNISPNSSKSQSNIDAGTKSVCVCPTYRTRCGFCKGDFSKNIRSSNCKVHGTETRATAVYCPFCGH